MDTFHVNIYIETSIKGPAVKEAAGEWIVEYVTGTGIPVTRSRIIWRKKTTENALTLELIRDAFSILTKTCCVRVNTPCEHVLSVVNNHWFPQWKKKGWINAKGNPVKNAELWQQIDDLMKNHFVEMCSEAHKYYDVMKYDIRKELGKIHAEDL